MKVLIMSLVLNSKFCTRGAAELIEDIIDEIDVDDYNNAVEVLETVKDALCDGEYLAKAGTNQKTADRAYKTVEDIIKTVVMVRKLHPYWD